MIRKHLSTIVYLTLIVAVAVPYGVFIGIIQAPLWVSLLMAAVSGVVIAVVVAPVAQVILHRLEDRARVRRDFDRDGGVS